jgi:DNA-binding transcriptional MerR regulator
MHISDEQLEQLFGVTGAARLAGCAAETIRDNERRGLIKAMKTETGVRIFMRSEIERFKAAREAQQIERRRRAQ